MLMSKVDRSLNLVEAYILWHPANPKVANQSLKVRDLLECGERQRIMASTWIIKGDGCNREISAMDVPIYMDSEESKALFKALVILLLMPTSRLCFFIMPQL